MTKDSNPNNWRLVAKEDIDEVGLYLESLNPINEPSKIRLKDVIHTLDSGTHTANEAPDDFKDETRRTKFYNDYVGYIEKNGVLPSYIIVAVSLPNGAVEIITNSYEIIEKVEYYLVTYDKDLRMKAYSAIEILSWMFA